MAASARDFSTADNLDADNNNTSSPVDVVHLAFLLRSGLSLD